MKYNIDALVFPDANENIDLIEKEPLVFSIIDYIGKDEVENYTKKIVNNPLLKNAEIKTKSIILSGGGQGRTNTPHDILVFLAFLNWLDQRGVTIEKNQIVVPFDLKGELLELILTTVVNALSSSDLSAKDSVLLSLGY